MARVRDYEYIAPDMKVWRFGDITLAIHPNTVQVWSRFLHHGIYYIRPRHRKTSGRKRLEVWQGGF